MDSGFLSSSEAPKPVEQPQVEVVPELAPQVALSPVEQPHFNEAKLESEAVQVQAPAVVVAAEPVTDAQLAATPAPPAIVAPVDEVVSKVQQILEEGLDEAIVAMPEAAKLRFLQKGKEIGTIVADMVRRYKVEVKRVFTLLKDWLTTIPGVSRFFLEKEAKIKTDRILELERVRHEAVPA